MESQANSEPDGHIFDAVMLATGSHLCALQILPSPLSHVPGSRSPHCYFPKGVSMTWVAEDGTLECDMDLNLRILAVSTFFFFSFLEVTLDKLFNLSRPLFSHL